MINLYNVRALSSWPRASLPHFEQLSFLERVNPSSLPKVMVVSSFFVLNLGNPISLVNLYYVRTLPCWATASLPHFEQHLFSERLNPSSLSKVMAV